MRGALGDFLDQDSGLSHSQGQALPRPTYSVGVDGKLALSIPQAIFDEGKVARVSIGSSDPQNDCAHSHILKNGLLERGGEGGERGGKRGEEGKRKRGAWLSPGAGVFWGSTLLMLLAFLGFMGEGQGGAKGTPKTPRNRY